MSYCRFSSMNFRCDVYVYADVLGGYTTHVAGARLLFPTIPPIPQFLYLNLGQKWDAESQSTVYPTRWRKWVGTVLFTLISWWERLRLWLVMHSPKTKIDLPLAGSRFNDKTALFCASRLMLLRCMGYKVPQYAIDALMEEHAKAA